MSLFLKTPMADYARRVVALKGQQDRMFKLALDTKVIRELIIFLNTDDQFGKDHVDSLGKGLFNSLTDRTTYSLFDQKGRGGKPYTLRDTGEFWDSFKIIVGQGKITITADPIKDTDNLFDIFGKDIVGLTEENLQVLIDEALRHFIKWYEDNILPK